MANLIVYQEYGEELERRLRLKTFPLALKLLEKEEDVPEGAKRPKKDFGHHLSLCQTFQMSRREGKIMAMLPAYTGSFQPYKAGSARWRCHAVETTIGPWQGTRR